MFRYLCLSALLLVSAAGCQQGKKKEKTAPIPPATQETAPPPDLPDPIKYPSIELEKLVTLYKEATYMDALFYDLPISMSQSDQASIRQTLSFISELPAVIYPDCEPIGRFFFQKNGDDLAVAELYFGKKCYAFVFLENEKPVYGNKLTEEGLQNYKKIFGQFNLPQ